jgi:hypothetical protein
MRNGVLAGCVLRISPQLHEKLAQDGFFDKESV